jgi:cytochrome P450
LNRAPSPPGHLIAGHVPEYAADRLGTMTRFAREYGDVVRLRLGPVRGFQISHPDLIEEVLVKQHHAFRRVITLRLSRRTFGRSMLIESGPPHIRRRRLAQPAFHRRRIAGYVTAMTEAADRRLGHWSDGAVLDMHAEMSRLTLDVVGRTLFAADVEDDADDIGAVLDVVMRNFTSRMNATIPLPDGFPSRDNLRLRRALARLDAIIARVLAETRAGRGGDHLLAMLAATRDEEHGALSDAEIRDEAVAFFLAGHETTALTLSWALYLLSQHPDVARQVEAEVEAVLGDRAPALEDLARLPYVSKVLRETMRLYPPAYAVPRDAAEDVEVGGYRIPARSIVIMPQWVVHRDPRFWDRPEVFDPDRWTPELESSLPRYAYFPFGGGPHLCIGAQFASAEATIVLAMIAQRFRLRATRAVEPEPLITLRPKGGVPMTISARNPQTVTVPGRSAGIKESI